MKKLIYSIFLLALGFGFVACEGEDPTPVFSVDTVHQITAPTTGNSYVFTEDNVDEAFETIEWTDAKLSPSNLPALSYRLELDFAGNDFASPIILTTTKELSYSTTVGQMNSALVGQVNLLAEDTTVSVEIRVVGSIDDAAIDPIISNVVAMDLTLFQTIVSDNPIYLLGSATDAGWDNMAALATTPLGDGKYEIVAKLIGGELFKFIENLGAWAPQWGTDGTGTWESGTLAYRPTEDDPDPDAIPAPPETSQYKITADINNLTYEVVPFAEIYLLGSGTAAGWDNTLAMPVYNTDTEGVYTIDVELIGGELWKIIDDLGAWAPQWGTDGTGTWESGTLAYRPTEDDPDPDAVPCPPDTGMYRIDIDLNNLTYTVTPL